MGEEKGPMRLTFVPVAHLSKGSVALVRKTIEREMPQYIGLELCKPRLEALVRGTGSPSLSMALSHPTTALMHIAQQLLGRWWNLKPGEEMLEALRASRDIQRPILLLDQDIRITSRPIEGIPLREKIGILLAGGMPGRENGGMAVETLLDPKKVQPLLAKMKKEFPATYEVFVSSRDKHMFEKLMKVEPESAVVVVGAAHVPGLLRLVKESEGKGGRKIKAKIAR
ncbi:MAG: TraB domain-containing protein [Candidatus Bilamarchaeaceae archaeon]